MTQTKRLDLQIVTCTAANTEYTFLLPKGTKQFTIVSNTANAALRIAYESGEVATGDRFLGIGADESYYEFDLDLDPQTLYIASDTAGAIAVITYGT